MKRFDPCLAGQIKEVPTGDYVLVDDVLAVIKDCWGYGGEYHNNDDHMEIYRHGIQTVLRAMNGALLPDTGEMQLNFLLGMGRRANETGILPNEDDDSLT